MGEISKIQWTDATWNIAVGCKKVDADCLFCYMYRGSLNGTRYDPKEIRVTKSNTFRMPLRLKEPSKIFTSSLTDFFLPELDEARREAWKIIKACPQHTFQILTKRPELIRNGTLMNERTETGGIIYRNMPNVIMGTSVGHEDGAHRITQLINSSWRGYKFLSIEPMHGPVNLRPHLQPYEGTGKSAIHWVIVGGESGNDNGKYKYRPCEIEWIEDVINKCWEADVPVFVKQLGTHLSKKLKLSDRHGGNIDEWPEHLRVRQFPDMNNRHDNPEAN